MNEVYLVNKNINATNKKRLSVYKGELKSHFKIICKI